ncbi:MAG: serine/threonine protein kinase [Piscinibacter sp.]|nr:serine/threonine protein kinase [Piscinibacter sp.]
MTHPVQLGKYPIVGVLGEGAMGVVYRAVDPVIQRPVAIKTVHRALLDDEDPVASFAARFRNEARSAGRLAHPGIVAVYEFGEDAHTAYIVMEFVEGRTLARRLGAGPAPDVAETVALMEQLLDALAHAHAQGVWHRDIKPANLIVTPEGRLKITDFGIARLADVALTQTHATIGTPGYMAPEQYTGAALDHRVDLFAAGAVLYRLLAGRPAFSGSPDVVMYQILNETPPPPSQFGAAPAFDAVIARALARDPAQRFADAASFRASLRAAAGQPGGDNDATRVLAPPPAAPVPTFEATELQAVEAALATAIGPVARVLVRQAARSAADRAGLLANLAGQIAEPARRETFLARLGQTGRPLTGPETPRPTAVGSPAVDPAVLEHATRVLTTSVGPIAKVLVRKAAARASSAEQLYDLLAEDTAIGAERDALLKRLREPG